jgi:hypothetical protein
MEYTFIPQSTLGTRYDPGHDIFVKVGPNVGSFAISPGDMPLTVGGGGNAAGRNGVLLADWPNGNSAIGTKELLNGIRTAHYGAYAVGVAAFSDSDMLLRNMVGWAGGGIPSPKIPAFDYVFGDNGVYTVDFSVIDDDMGYTFDTTSNMPVEDPNIGGVQMSHRFVTVSVDNVDPVITGLDAFMAGEVCVRIDGTVGNSVTADVYTDGVLSLSLSVTRQAGPPGDDDDDDDGGIGNPGIRDDDDDDDGPAPTEACGVLLVDVTASHTYDARLTYSGPMGGSNNVQLIIQPWRDPVSRGHGDKTYFYRFSPTRPSVVDQPLPTLKGDLFDGGRGAKVDFVAEAYDVGTDDLAFFWSYGSLNDVAYNPLTSASVYTIHVHHNSGAARSDGVLAGPQILGYSELFFQRDTTGRSPLGTINFNVRDTAFHAFSSGSGDDDDDDDDGGSASSSQQLYYVMLLVLDDDNTRGYPSTFMNDGIDMEFLVIDLSGPTSHGDDDDDDDDDD